jgi:hypothetical protein
MKKDRLVLDFKKLSVPEKIAFGRNVYSLMTENPSFPTPDVQLEQLKLTTDGLETRNVASQSGGKEETVLLHQAEYAWDYIMSKEGRYVERIADGDGAIILSAGFNLAKQPAPGQKSEFSVELGDRSGSVVLKRQAVAGAKSYIWQHCIHSIPENEASWITAEVTSRASVEISGLTPLSKYWFRVAVVTPQGTSAYSPAVMQAVL